MKHTVAFIAAGVLSLGLGVSSGSNVAQASQSISLATGGTGGVYFPLGGAMAEAWSQQIPDLRVTAESTGASVVNVRIVEQGEAELAMVQNDIANYAFHATEMFADDSPKESNLGMALLYPEVIQIVTLADSGIESVNDLAGARVAVGAPGSGTEANARQILMAHDIAYADITEHFLPFGEAVDAIRDGRIDAAFLTAGIPTAAVVDLGATHDVSIVPVDPDMAEEVSEEWPFYAGFTIPGGTYSGIEDDIPTVTVLAMLVANADLDADLVEQMLEVLFAEETLERLCDTHARGCDISLEDAAEAMPVPLHPGAEAFFERQ
ncbi:TAXI family TRAP transporter solute-binding subunit [Aquisalimonas sp.]|uniref:TAXI family TRAP transporter solute-binding subunit n=1 Tax=Aquisalimonas sp. TaxID=1872621 RepID=UPI0025BA0B3A|nr:TAXI family TRAP transporter solute-binding subunit [Aquisalimonas sp.]